MSISKVFFIKNVSKESFASLIQKINFDFLSSKEFVALKVHFGEEKNTEFIKPEIFKPLVKKLYDLKTYPFFTDTNTIYAGKRANAITHLKLAQQHGFSAERLSAPVVIADGLKGNDSVEVKIGKKYFESVKVASYIYYANALICLSHFKGHMMFGFGGTIKNLGMGCSPRPAKFLLHNSLRPKLKVDRCSGCGLCVDYCSAKALVLNEKISFLAERCVGCGECVHICPNKVFYIPWDSSYKEVQEKTVEYAYGVWKVKQGKCLFFSFLDNINKDCDCMETRHASVLKNIGILASTDPLSIDIVSLKIVNEEYSRLKGKNEDLFKTFWPEINYNYQIEYAREIGLGSDKYELVVIN